VPRGGGPVYRARMCASATGRPLADDELRLIGAHPGQLALLYPGLLS
jgi:hypothetical protein